MSHINGTLWVTGTHHSIFVVGYALRKLGYKILNDIAWEKPNPPPNLSCRCFTHSTETLIWAARSDDTEHVFNYDLMRGINSGRQMQTVWTLGAPAAEEKASGQHPAQKPVALVTRCLLAATREGSLVLDPFLGSGTTAIACLRTGRHFVGMDFCSSYVKSAVSRTRAELERGKDLFIPR
ncbi:MAG: site-specific DNA-methyltransferase [Verrucomicrobiota bacterium]